MPQVTSDELYMVNTLHVREESRDDFLTALRQVLPLARSLEGCLLLEVGEDASHPNTFVLTERWKNGFQYLNEYLQEPFYQEYLAQSVGVYSAPRQVLVLSRVSA